MALTPLRINPPLKGVNTISPVREMTHEYAIRLDNVWMDKAAGIQRRPGQTSIIPPHVNPIDRLFEYVSPAVASTLFAHDSITGDILRQSGATWVIEAAAGVFTSTPSVGQMGGQIIVGDGVRTAVYNGSTWNTAVTGIVTTPYNNNCKFYVPHNGRMYAAGSSTHGSTIYFSDAVADGGTTALGLFDWTTGATGPGGFIDVSAAVGKGEIVTGLASYQGLLVVFCRNNIVLYNITDPLTSFSVHKVIKGVGCLSHDSIAGAGNDTVFLSGYGFLKLREVLVQGDAAVERSSVAINNYITDQLASGNYSAALVRSAYAENIGVYLCSFGTKVTWAYHEMFGGWAPWYGVAPQLLYSAAGTLYTANSELFTMDAAVNMDTTSTATHPINFVWEPAPFRSSGQEVKARWNRAEVIYEAAGSTSFTLASWLNLDQATKQTNTTTLAPTNIVANPTGMVWGTGTPTLDPRTKWGGVGIGGSAWGGTVITGNQLLAGDAVIPLVGRSELLSLSISNADVGYFRISAIEVYRNDGGVRK